MSKQQQQLTFPPPMRFIIPAFTLLLGFCSGVTAADQSVCDHAFTYTGQYTNAECRQKCLTSGEEGPEFQNGNCKIEEWTAPWGTTEFDKTDCLKGWLPGFGDYSALGDMFGNTETEPLTTVTAAECQDLCDATPECFYFTWRPSDRQCLRKTYEMVSKAVNVHIDVPADLDSNFCSASMGGAPYSFVECDGQRTCVYKSSLHVGGPFRCGLQFDWCSLNPDSPAPTLKPEGGDTTTIDPDSICNHAFTYSDKLTNAECRQECASGGVDAPAFKQGKCKIEQWTAPWGTTVFENTDCLTGWVAGYGDYSDLADMVHGAEAFTTGTASECQDSCAAVDGCFYFNWRPSDKQCLRKTYEMVANAASMTIDVAGALDSTFCNAVMAKAPYTFSECNSERTCVYNSALHVGGPFRCGVTLDWCSLNPNEAAPTLKPSN